VGEPLCSQILLRQGRPPSTIIGIRKLESYPTRRWRPHPSAFRVFDTIPECDRRTDRQTDDGFAVTYTALVKLALRHAKTVRVNSKGQHSVVTNVVYKIAFRSKACHPHVCI